jgi:predicted O-linked N-acetylglucosamine transferase (SPINDLY family)
MKLPDPAELRDATAALTLGELIHAAAMQVQSGNRAGACDLYNGWIAANETHALKHVALFNLSTIYSDAGDPVSSMRALQQAIRHSEDFLPAYINLGRLFEAAGQPEQALELWYAGVSRPMSMNGLSIQHTVTALKQIARLQMEREDDAAAEQALSRCLSIDPTQDDALEQYLALRMRTLQWPVLTPLENLSGAAMLRRFHPLSVAAFTDDPYLQLATAQAYAKRLLAHEGAYARALDRRTAPIGEGRRLRVGFVSSDLRDHAIGYLLTEFFEVMDRGRIEVFAYFIGQAPTSAITTRIETAVEHWVDLRGQGDDAAAARIGADGIDILVDVNGHTRDARLGIFARRPAPIQVNWLGFPGTMGTSYHQYIIADPWIVPPGSERHYSERVMRLPCYQPNDRKRDVAERPTRAAAGLPEDAFVFCSFNALHKVTRFTLERWATILAATPGSVLWMLDCAQQTKDRVAAAFLARGVDPSRIIYAPKLQNAHHLARYPLADLFLDALPYGAHTTASDALWMSVPVLTLSGRCFASRVCGSLVRSAGTPELVMSSPDAYVARAIALANDRGEIARLKATLEEKRPTAVTFDQDLLARSIADLFDQMAKEYRAGALPQPDLANLERYMDAGLAFDHEATEIAWHEDYEGWYRAQLIEMDRRAPLTPDTRLWPPSRAN